MKVRAKKSANHLCPRCKAPFVRWSRQAALFASLLSRFHRFPFRCQLCGHRFWAFRKRMAGISIDTTIDRREYDRLPENHPVSFIGADIMGDGYVSDISFQGCLVQTAMPAPPATPVSLSLFHSEYDAPIDIAKAMVRHRTPKGFGVEFLRVNPKEEKRLRLRLSRLLSGIART